MLINQAYMSANVHEMSTNIEDGKVDPYIFEAEQFDIKDTISELLFVDIVNNTGNYATLLNGGDYQYSGNTYSFLGLKKAIAYFAFARMVMNLNVSVTRWGVVQKNNTGINGNDVSEHLDRTQLSYFSNGCKNKAVAILNDCIRFIERNITDYPLYNCHTRTIKKSGTKLSAVGKTIKRGAPATEPVYHSVTGGGSSTTQPVTGTVLSGQLSNGGQTLTLDLNGKTISLFMYGDGWLQPSQYTQNGNNITIANGTWVVGNYYYITLI